MTYYSFPRRPSIGIDIEEKVNIVLGIVSIRKSRIGPSLAITNDHTPLTEAYQVTKRSLNKRELLVFAS